MTDIDVLQSGIAILTSDHNPKIVNGVVIGEDDITEGMSGQRTFWPGDVLRDAADGLIGKPVVKNHPGVERNSGGLSLDPQPPIEDVVGAITQTRYRDGVGLLFQAEIDDEQIATQIERGRADVSPVVYRTLGEFDDENDAYPVEEITGFRDLGIVSEGASPSNTIQPGAATAMMADALSGEFDSTDDPEALAVSIHTPEFSSTTTGEWNSPALEDFGEDPDLGDVDDHFIVSRTGFPPDNFGDLALPVVSPDGALHLSALRNAKARLGQVSGVSSDEESRITSIIDRLANENFESAEFGEDGEANASNESESDESAEAVSDTGNPRAMTRLRRVLR